MTWRPWVIVSLGLVAGVLLVTLLVTERIPSVEQGPELKKIQEKLRTLQYLPNNRRANFEVMGLDNELADAAARYVGRYDRQTEKLKKILDEETAELSQALCPSEDLPQPYAAMKYLLEESSGARYVVDPIQLRTLEPQEWYDRSLVPALYDHFERSEARKADATVMAVSSVILAREVDALEGVAPWSLGLVGSWGFGKLKSREPRIQILVIEYFSLMHYLTELANSPRGICS
jgi:hypothetical protein